MLRKSLGGRYQLSVLWNTLNEITNELSMTDEEDQLQTLVYLTRKEEELIGAEAAAPGEKRESQNVRCPESHESKGRGGDGVW